MLSLNKTQINEKIKFIHDYINANNAADGSILDPNSNVTTKNVATMAAEINKDVNIQLMRQLIHNKIESLFDTETADLYINQLKNKEIYCNDETSVATPYCVAVSMYPFLLNGLQDFGGESKAPQHLSSFNGGFINLIFALSSQFAGACNAYTQPILYSKDGTTYSQLFGKFVDSFNLDKKFSNYQGDWEYADISDLNYQVAEDGKFVAIKKVYRRKYNKKIYRVKTKSGYSVDVSEDHIFKVLFRGRELEVKAKDLLVHDTVFMNKDMSTYIHKDILEFKKGFVIGMVCGDGGITREPNVTLSVNYTQEFLANTFNEYLKDLQLPELNKGEGHKCFAYTKHSQPLYDFLTTHIQGTTTYDKHIDVQKHSLDFLIGFLDGIFCADGSYSETRGIHITLTNKLLIENIEDILKKIYLPCNAYNIIPANSNKKESYSLYIPARIIKYLLNTPKKLIKRGKLTDIGCSREIYYYGKHAFKLAKSGTRYNVSPISRSKQSITYTTDVIDTIEVLDYVHDYVYEIETSTNWYNDGGFITHNCATVEYLTYFNHFAIKDYGKNYLNTHTHIIEQELQQTIYALNQPASARNYQCPFWNVSIFDKHYFEALFKAFYFPDGTQPQWKYVNKLQQFFLKWFNKERTKALLTFPVVTVSVLNDREKVLDEEYANIISTELSEGNSFFVYTSPTVDSLSSCCRLSNNIEDQLNDFSYSLGAGGVSTGSMNVIVLNMNRFVQNVKESMEVQLDITNKEERKQFLTYLQEKLKDQIKLIHKYQLGFKALFKELQDKNMLPAYTAGFISLDKQYLTIGINGLVESAEFLGYTANNNDDYKQFVGQILKTISDTNKETCRKVHGLKINTELVPAENLGVKFAKWDTEEGLVVTRDCYNSYFYPVEDEDLTVIDKFTLHGKEITQYLDGGSALHLNLEDTPTKETCDKLLDLAVKTGCPYFCINVKVTVCNSCKHIDKRTNQSCTKCGSKDIDYATRVIGYLRKVTNFSKERQLEESNRYYHKGE